MPSPLYALTQELYDDIIAGLAEVRAIKARLDHQPTPPKPSRDVWAQITSTTTQAILIGGVSRSGYYPATWHYRDEEDAAWSTGVECWIKDANAVALKTGRYFRAYLASADDGGKAIFFVDRDISIDSSGNVIIEGDLIVEGDTTHEGDVTHEGTLILIEQAPPSTPNNGYGLIYVDVNGIIWFINDAGTAYNLTAGVKVRKNSAGSTFGPRSRINFIEGSGVTLTVADDAGNDEVDVTIAASGGGTTGTNGEAVLASDLNIANATFEDSGLKVTLPTAGTYLIQGEIHLEAQASDISTGAELYLRLYNETDAAAVSDSTTFGLLVPENGILYKGHCPIGKIVTTDGANEVIRVEARKNSTSPTWTSAKVMASASYAESRLRYVKLA